MKTLDRLVPQPHEMAFDSRRRLVYLTHTYRGGGYGDGAAKGHEISVIDPDRMVIVDVIDISPYSGMHDIEVEPNSDLIIGGIERDDDGRKGLLLLDGESRRIISAVETAAPNIHWISLNPDGSKAYCSSKEWPEISVVDVVKRRQIASIPVPGGAEEISCASTDGSAYVATPMMPLTTRRVDGESRRVPLARSESRLLKIDPASHQVVGALAFEGHVCAVSTTSDGKVIVAEWRFRESGVLGYRPTNGFVHVVDGISLQIIGSVEAGEMPFTSRSTPDGAYGFVAEVKSGAVSVIDLKRVELAATLDSNMNAPGGFGGTHGICFVPPPT